MTTTGDGRIGRVEGILEEVRTRLNNLEVRVGNLESRMQTQFLWLMGTMLGILIPMWVTIILAILLRM